MHTLTAGAVCLGALAAALVVAPAPRGPSARGPAAPWPDRRAGWLVLGLCAGGLVVAVDGAVLALGLVCVGAVAAALRLVAREQGRRAADRRADRVLDLCEALAGELRSGQPPQRALRHGVEVWPELEPVAAAADLGADVPVALRRLAGQPGASGLRQVASAWQVSADSGATMATALGRVADAARERRASQRLVAAELASAQATARMVAALPLFVLTLGAGVGSDPWAFLLRTTVGLSCLGLGLALAFAGMFWIARIAETAVEG